MENSPSKLKDGRTVRIRPAVPEDAAAITELVNAVGSEGRSILRERATWTIEEERRTLGAADGRQAAFFVAEVSGQLGGMIHLARGKWTKDSHVAELGMSCLSHVRRVGLGTALLARGIDWARSVGVRKLTLEVFGSNEPAMALYRKMGFLEEARLRGEYLIEGQLVDGVRMALWL